MKTVLTIAGFDPSSGAGITADLAVFAAHGLFGTSCITALTVQNTLGVEATQAIAADTVRQTLICLDRDLPPAGIKIGMLANAEIVSVVTAHLRGVRAHRPCIVVLDPVLKSSSGKDLLDTHAREDLLRDLIPEVDWITPNLDELRTLTGESSLETAAAAAKLQQHGRELNIIVTGGDLRPPTDFLLEATSNQHLIPGPYINSTSTHGTGCAFSSALLSRLVLGDPPLRAARAAKDYVTEAIRSAKSIGHGHGPLNHLWPLRPPQK